MRAGSLVILVFFLTAAPSLGRDLNEADNNPPYEEFLRQQQGKKAPAEEETPPAEEGNRPPSRIFIFTDRYGVTHFVGSLDRVPLEYRDQITGRKNNLNTQPTSSPLQKNLTSADEMAVSSAGLGPDWSRNDEMMVSAAGIYVKESHPDRKQEFELLNVEFKKAGVLSWSLHNYLQVEQERIEREILAYFWVFRSLREAEEYVRRLADGLGTASAGYHYQRFFGSYRSDDFVAIEVRESEKTLRKLFVLRWRNGVAALSFAPEDVDFALKIAELANEFTRRNIAGE